jgi:hypothetical protein
MVLVIEVNEEARSVCPEQANTYTWDQRVSAESLNALSAGDRVSTLAVSWKRDGV